MTDQPNFDDFIRGMAKLRSEARQVRRLKTAVAVLSVVNAVCVIAASFWFWR